MNASTLGGVVNRIPCHREGIDAFAYLSDVLTRLPTEANRMVHRLTPTNWAADQAEVAPQMMAHTAVVAQCVTRTPVKQRTTELSLPDAQRTGGSNQPQQANRCHNQHNDDAPRG